MKCFNSFRSRIGLRKIFFALSTVLLLPLVFNSKTHAQDVYDINNPELRHLFQNIANPNPGVRFLYDLSLHAVDSQFFDDNCLDTNYASGWYALYKEMWWMAYDTNSNTKVQNIVIQAQSFISRDTIPIAIMDWNYNLLKPDALTTNTYFNFDTVNNVLYDKPGAPSPFTVQNTFAVAPLALQSHFLNPTFTVNPQFMFKDINYKGMNWELRINFSDGTGWHNFHDNAVQSYVASYSSAGYKAITCRLVDQFGTTMKESISKILILGNSISSPPDSVIQSVPGLTGSIYNPPGCTPNAQRKYVIYLEGFDIFNTRNAPQIYSEMIIDEDIVQLKNQGYSFLIVNWTDGTAPLVQNAESLIKLIETLNCEGSVNGQRPPPHVIIGESMSGLIARYALCEMERPNYRRTCPPYDGAYHNTRLLITVDAPHQGANIPLSLQYIYKYASGGLLGALGLTPLANHQLSQLFTALNGAASEMLIYHVGTDPFLPLPVSVSPIGEHWNKTIFDNKLRDLGNYPRFCKLVALSNGSWLGARQRQPYGTLNEREINDILLSLDGKTEIRILGIKIMGSQVKFAARTNPDGIGSVLNGEMGVSHWKIKLRWFSIRLDWHTTYLFHMDKTVMGVKPYCVMPGSNLSSGGIGLEPDEFVYPDPENPWNVLVPFGLSYSSTGNGELNIDAHLAHPILGGLYVNVQAFSNGFGFAFIPTASSFDYNSGGAPLDHSILFEPVPVAGIMDRTPFDVVYTNPTRNNLNHLRINNAELGIYETCIPNGHEVHSYLINREIGDDSLLLENYVASYEGVIEAERDILINERNIYYNYENDLSPITTRFSAIDFPNRFNPNNGGIVLSKANPVHFAMTGQLTSNDNITINPSQPPSGLYSWSPGSMVNCCVVFQQKSENPIKADPESKKHEGYLSAYPNPANDHITIKFKLNTNDPVVINVYNSIGQLVKTWKPKFADQTQHCFFSILNTDFKFVPGVYYMKLNAGNEQHDLKFVVK